MRSNVRVRKTNISKKQVIHFQIVRKATALIEKIIIDTNQISGRKMKFRSVTNCSQND